MVRKLTAETIIKHIENIGKQVAALSEEERNRLVSLIGKLATPTT